MLHGSLPRVMGTRFDMLIIDKSEKRSQEIWNKIVPELLRLDLVFNRFDSTSETSRINKEALAGTVGVSPEMWSILQNCLQYNIQTLKLFDITLKDFSSLLLDEKNHTAHFLRPGISLDFGGYAKGFALEKIKKMLGQSGVKHSFVNFGNSSILGIGHHPYGDSWKVSVVNPFTEGESLDEISLRDEALSVSGNTPVYTGHTVRPDSGVTVNGRKVVSVTSTSPLDAEILSTAFMIATPEEKKLIRERFEYERIVEYNL